MTIPYLMNCPHDGDGWCLACVKRLGEQHEHAIEALRLAYRHVHLADEDVASGEVGEALGNALAESMGDEAFQAWVKQVDPWQDDDDD